MSRSRDERGGRAAAGRLMRALAIGAVVAFGATAAAPAAGSGAGGSWHRIQASADARIQASADAGAALGADRPAPVPANANGAPPLTTLPPVSESTPAEGSWAPSEETRILVLDPGDAAPPAMGPATPELGAPPPPADDTAAIQALLLRQQLALIDVRAPLPVHRVVDAQHAGPADILVRADAGRPATLLAHAAGGEGGDEQERPAAGLVVSGDPAELPLAARVLVQQLAVHGAVPGGRHVFAPDSEVRAVHIDIARKHYPIAALQRLVREMAWSGMNELELHFSENEGFAIESRPHPEIESAVVHSQDDIRGLIDYAATHGVRVTPSLDMPGHLDHALEAHPELRLRDAAGGEVFGALDVRNPAAIEFALDLVDEFAPLFGSGVWNLGADEFVDFDDAFEVGALDAWARGEFGPAATAYDAQTWFVNLVAERLAEHGFRTRVWSDGMLRADVVELRPDVEVAYWTQRPPGAVPAGDFAALGHRLVNVNDEFLYFVLGERVGYLYPSGEEILAEWDAGTFPSIDGSPERLPFGGADAGDAPLVRGGMFAIWSDIADALTADEVVDAVRVPVAATALKLAEPATALGWGEFTALLDRIGPAPELTPTVVAAAVTDAAELAPLKPDPTPLAPLADEPQPLRWPPAVLGTAIAALLAGALVLRWARHDRGEKRPVPDSTGADSTGLGRDLGRTRPGPDATGPDATGSGHDRA